MIDKKGYITILVILLTFLVSYFVIIVIHPLLFSKSTVRRNIAAMQRLFNERVAVVRIIEGFARNPAFVPPGYYSDIGVSASVYGSVYTSSQQLSYVTREGISVTLHPYNSAEMEFIFNKRDASPQRPYVVRWFSARDNSLLREMTLTSSARFLFGDIFPPSREPGYVSGGYLLTVSILRDSRLDITIRYRTITFVSFNIVINGKNVYSSP